MKDLTGRDLHDLQTDPPLCPDCAAKLHREVWFDHLERINTNGHGGDYKNVLHCKVCGSVFEYRQGNEEQIQ